MIDLGPGRNFCIPYFSNLAASGLVAAAVETGDDRYMRAAWDWLDWYARHMDARGFVTNYRWTGASWVSTGRMDSTDSYAATFIIAVRDAYEASGDLARLESLWPAMRLAVNAMVATDTGTWLTYALPDYPHAFLMDNIEVYEAFRIVEHLAGEVVVDPRLRHLAGRWAAAMPAAFETYWNEARGGYDIAIGSRGERFLVDYATLYPGVTAQVWMLRTGLVSPQRAASLVQRIEQAHPQWERSGEQPSTAWFPEIVDGYRYAGMSARAEQGLATMVASIRAAGRAWPHHGGTAGRIIRLMAGRTETVLSAAPQAYVQPGAVSFGFAGAPELSTGGSVSFECSLDGAPFVTCPAQHAVPALAEGAHVLRVRARDAAGHADATPVVLPWRVDATPPAPSFTATPLQPANARATFAFTAADAAPAELIWFECSLDGAAFTGCVSPATLTVAGTGTHSLRLRGRDPAGNLGGTIEFSWFADGTPPDTAILSGPTGVVPVGDVRFAFGGSDDRGVARYECRVAPAAFANCASPLDVSVGEGAWTFQVRAVDTAGNADPTPATRTWSVDRTPPNTALLEWPVPASSNTVARLVFTGSDNVAGPLRFECSLDGAAFDRCTSPHTTAPLGSGTHVFEVRAIDGAGYADPTPARAQWIVDVSAPDTVFGTSDGSIVTQAPPVVERVVHGTITDDAAGVATVAVRFVPVDPTANAIVVAASVECSDAARHSCVWRAAAPSASGRYRVSAKAVDRAGNEGAAEPSQIVVYVL